MTTHIITWQSPSGKIVTSRPLTPAAARAEIEQNQQHTPDWRYTVEPPLPDLQAMLDAANQRIANQDAMLNQQQNIIAVLYQQQNAANARIAELERLLDILPQKD